MDDPASLLFSLQDLHRRRELLRCRCLAIAPSMAAGLAEVVEREVASDPREPRPPPGVVRGTAAQGSQPRLLDHIVLAIGAAQ